jgi:hypothetical protein
MLFDHSWVACRGVAEAISLMHRVMLRRIDIYMLIGTVVPKQIAQTSDRNTDLERFCKALFCVDESGRAGAS